MFKLFVCGLLVVSSSGILVDDGETFTDGEQIGLIDSEAIKEVSGCAFSRIHDNMMYVHNDKGDTARLFAIDATSATVAAEFTLTDIVHHDFEDIAVGPCGKDSSESCIYVLDGGAYGDNNDTAKTILKFVEPSEVADQAFVADDSLVYAYDEPQTTVLMITPGANLYMISSVEGGHGLITEITADDWDSEDPIALDSTARFAMDSVGYHDPAGGDISTDGLEMLVKHREAAYYYAIVDGEVIEPLTKPGYAVPVAVEPQGEAICWNPDSSAYYTLSEGVNQPLYKYTRITV